MGSVKRWWVHKDDVHETARQIPVPSFQQQIVLASDHEALERECEELRKVALQHNHCPHWEDECEELRKRAEKAEAHARNWDSACAGVQRYALQVEADRDKLAAKVERAIEALRKESSSWCNAANNALAILADEKTRCSLCCPPGRIVEATTGDYGHGFGKCVERRNGERRTTVSKCALLSDNQSGRIFQRTTGIAVWHRDKRSGRDRRGAR